MADKVKRGGKKNRKHKRNQVWCQAYRARGEREKNKAVRLQKHIARHLADSCTIAALGRIGRLLPLPVAA